jgi:hypothetical protein
MLSRFVIMKFYARLYGWWQWVVATSVCGCQELESVKGQEPSVPNPIPSVCVRLK